MMSKETRMAIHVAALKANWEKPGSYREFTRCALEQEQTSAGPGPPTIVALANLPADAGENCRREPIRTTHLFGRKVATERSARPAGPRLSINTGAKRMGRLGQSLPDRLEVVSLALG